MNESTRELIEKSNKDISRAVIIMASCISLFLLSALLFAVAVYAASYIWAGLSFLLILVGIGGAWNTNSLLDELHDERLLKYRSDNKGRLYRANPISEESWLTRNEYEEFRKGYLYASYQTYAVRGLSKISPESAYYIWSAINRGIDKREN